MGSMITVNGAELYREVRGSGPALLFIAGATGDAGYFSHVADSLADEFTTVTYDRRGNSRSPRPEGWVTTTVGEQADDAAELLRALDLGRATVFGTSSGAIITADLVARHPDTVQQAYVHEPPLIAALPNADEITANLTHMIEETMAASGPRGVIEQFLRMVGTPFDDLPAALRERVLGNADVFLNLELPGTASYLPDLTAMKAAAVPIRVLSGAESRGVYLHDAASWLANSLGTDLSEMEGGHVPYLTHPAALSRILRSHVTAAHRR